MEGMEAETLEACGGSPGVESRRCGLISVKHQVGGGQSGTKEAVAHLDKGV